jgi:hypothetical protein
MRCWSDGPLTTLAGLTVTAEHRRGHGALDEGLGSGRSQVDRHRRVAEEPAGAPGWGRGGSRWAVKISPWLSADDPRLALLLCRGVGAGPHLRDDAAGHGAWLQHVLQAKAYVAGAAVPARHVFNLRGRG